MNYLHLTGIYNILYWYNMFNFHFPTFVKRLFESSAYHHLYINISVRLRKDNMGTTDGLYK